MFYQLQALTSEGVTSAGGAAWVGAVVFVVGVLLWLAGSRFSQMLVTLTAVGVGALVGKLLPGWMNSAIDPIGTCFGGALVLGLLGYVYHRMWVGAGLGVLVAGWGAIGTWLVMGHGHAWVCPALGHDLSALAKAVWESVPADMQRVMPWSVGGAALVAMALAAILPRVAGRMFYSMLGMSAAAAAALCMRRGVSLVKLLPSDAYAQLGVAVALVVVGMTVQYWLGPKRVKVASSPDASPGSA